ncbi:sugar transporter [Fusarium mexicanum]|uniref:Sugar transporter n=1 Tax=Fusarium mexicanum TaxID=751941 RepID=A0A8H5I5F5_9HYPO|nr:sugar transporter [Fusarium mexicanum]
MAPTTKTSINWTHHKWALFFCGISTFGALCYGYDQIYFTGVQGMQPFINDYAQTTTSDGKPALTTSFISLTASIIYVGELAGAFLAAPINENLGRRAVFLCASLCIIIGAIVQLASHGSEGLIVLGRIFIGLGIGQFTVTCLLYMGEVAPAAVRGPALMTFQLMQSCSQLVGSAITQGTSNINNKNSYLVPFGVLIVLPGLMILLLVFLPESPTWYVSKGKLEDGEKMLRKINKSMLDYDPSNDMRVLTEAVERDKALAAESSWTSLVTDPIERRKVIYSAGAMVAQQINGIQFFYSYGVIFAQSIGVSEPFTISLITNVLQVVAVAVSVYFGNRIPRRQNLWYSTLGLWAALIVVGGLGTTRSSSRTFSSAVSTAIVVFSYIVIVCFNFSLGPLAYTINSEMAVGRNRNKIVSVSISVFFITVFIIAFTAPYLYYSANLGPMMCFVYAGTSCISLAYIWFCVGETTGRTILEVERFFIEGIPARQWETHVFYHRTAEKDVSDLHEDKTAIHEVEVA